jgi:DeoR family glycerol-3-phosphate regulon repressor
MNNNTLTVITNNIEILSLMSDTGIKTLSSGGVLYSENRVCLVGEDAEYIFKNSFADIMFFSVKSLAEDGGLWDPSREEVLVRGAMLQNAAKKVFLCDSSKIGVRRVFTLCTKDDVDEIVCDVPLPWEIEP